MTHYPREVFNDAVDALIRGGRTQQEAWGEARRRLGRSKSAMTYTDEHGHVKCFMTREDRLIIIDVYRKIFKGKQSSLVQWGELWLANLNL